MLKSTYNIINIYVILLKNIITYDVYSSLFFRVGFTLESFDGNLCRLRNVAIFLEEHNRYLVVFSFKISIAEY